MAIMADIIASVEPQQTVISRSGSTATPCVRSKFAAMASRNFFAPQVIGVLIDVRGDRFLRGALDFGGRGKIGKALREIDGAVAEREPRHFADHGFGECVRPSRKVWD